MRPKFLGSLFAVVFFMVSGCSTTVPPSRLAAGAAIGGLLGGAAGCGIGGARGGWKNERSYEIGCPSGVVGGAVIGALIAGGTYHEPPPPPPAPPQVVQAPPPPPSPAPRAMERLVLRGVHFDFNKSDIRPEDEPVLDEAAAALKERPGVSIYVDGYCDAVGKTEYNQRLSERRAASVAAYLQSHGIPGGRLTPRGFGKTHFVASNDTADGRAENRRVELVPVE